MTHAKTYSLIRRLADSERNRCFVCGPGNPMGLRMRFDLSDGKIVSVFTPDPLHHGWEGVVHGGIIASVLDESMAYVLFFEGVQGLTGRMEVRYRAPAQAGDELAVEAAMVRDAPRIADVESRVSRNGTVVAEGQARFVKAGPLTEEILLAHLEGWKV